jgi:hypothetical protein
MSSAEIETGSFKQAFTGLGIVFVTVFGGLLYHFLAAPTKSVAAPQAAPKFNYSATRRCLKDRGLMAGQLTAATGAGTYVYASRSGHTAQIDVEPSVGSAIQQYNFDQGSGLVERFRNVEIVWFKGNPPALLKAYDSHPPRAFRAAVVSCLRT